MATLSEIQRDLNFTLRANVSQQDEIGQTLTAVNRLLDTLQQTFTEFSVGSLHQEHGRVPLPGGPAHGGVGESGQ
jgi:hypothetical protein